MQTSIFLEALKLSLKIGCTKEERSFNQIVYLDIIVNIQPLKEEINFSSLEQTVCYDSLRKEIIILSENRSFELLEELSEEISALTFNKFSNAKSIEITSSKNIYPDCDKAGVIFFKERN